MAEQSLISIQRSRMLNGINGVGKVLRSVGLDPFKLDAQTIINKAIKKAKFEDPLPEQLEEGIHQLIDSINTEAKPNPFGALAAKTLFERTMYNRLKVEQAFKADPSIADIEIKEPVFIIGMPRTGTSILHALLHEDPDNRSPLAWECLLPYPAPTPENFDDNEQLNTVIKEFDQLFKLVPDFQKKHHMSAISPQECIGIDALDFNSFQTSAQFYIPSYMEWINNQANKLITMKWHKRFLQYLQSGGVSGKRWLLKTPIHMMRLEELFTVYPDARILMTHRNPVKVVPSASSLISSVRSLYSDGEDAHRSGMEQALIWADYFTRFLDKRAQINKEDQIIDINFSNFVSDQISVVKDIYKKLGLSYTENLDNRFQQFLKNNPKDKHGVHDYSLDDFGLKESFIEEKYSNYLNFLNQLESNSHGK